MENQHRKITGYRELEQTEIDLMNEVKALGIQMEDTLKKVHSYIHERRAKAHKDVVEDDNEILFNSLENATPERFLAMAKTDFQTGLMYATRAVAQPEFF
jgi:hypothetical protein